MFEAADAEARARLHVQPLLWGYNPVCEVTPVILHGVVSPDLGIQPHYRSDFTQSYCSPWRTCNLTRTGIHHEHDFPLGIGALPSEMRLMAPMPEGGIVFMMNTRRDLIAKPETLKPKVAHRFFAFYFITLTPRVE